MTDSSLRVLVDVSQQAHAHLFKHAITELEERGHRTLVTSRKKGVITQLLDASGIDHRPISKQRRFRPALLPEWIVREHRLIAAARQFDPDVVVSQFNPCATHAAHLSGARSIVFCDDETATDAAGKVTNPFTTFVYTPEAFTRNLGPKHRRYDGYHELAYLHPDRFEPDATALRASDVDPESRYFLVQVAAWERETGESGLSTRGKRELVEFLGQHGTVYVDTPGELPAELPAEPVPVPAEQLHHFLAFADLYVGDSRTLALEAGTLGTPSVWSNPPALHHPGHVRKLESAYSLLLTFETESETVITAKNLAIDPKATERWAGRRDQMLADSIDVTSFMVEMVCQQGDKQQLASVDSEPTYELA